MGGQPYAIHSSDLRFRNPNFLSSVCPCQPVTTQPESPLNPVGVCALGGLHFKRRPLTTFGSTILRPDGIGHGDLRGSGASERTIGRTTSFHEMGPARLRRRGTKLGPHVMMEERYRLERGLAAIAADVIGVCSFPTYKLTIDLDRH